MEEDKIKRIREAAEKVFLQKGYKETKIKDIADVAGISPGTIYLYYKNKRELFSSLNIPEAEQLRPKYDKKRLEILKIALNMFGINGYNATSMEAIALACGFSKAVLYQYFNNKEELFTAIFEEEILKIFIELPMNDEIKDFHEVLTKVAYNHYETLIEPEKLNLIRVIMAETGKFPQIGKILYENAIDVAAEKLSAYLEKYNELGIIDCPNTKLYARNFLGNIVSFVIVDELINSNNREFSKDEILKSIVSIFEKSVKTKND